MQKINELNNFYLVYSAFYNTKHSSYKYRFSEIVLHLLLLAMGFYNTKNRIN